MGLKRGLICAGQISLGGAIDPIRNAEPVAELVVKKGATTLFSSIAYRGKAIDLSDDMATKFNIVFYVDAQDAFLKELID